MNTTGMTKEKLLIVTLPNPLTFKHKGIIDFDNILKLFRWDHEGNSVTIDARHVNVNIRMYNFDDVQCTVIPSVAYGFVTGMNLQLC